MAESTWDVSNRIEFESEVRGAAAKGFSKVASPTVAPAISDRKGSIGNLLASSDDLLVGHRRRLKQRR